MEVMRSSLKSWILTKTQHVIDISSRAQFPKFSQAWKGLLQRSVNQRGNQEMYTTLDDTNLKKIFGFIGHLTELILSRGSKDYDDMLERLPLDQQSGYHNILQVAIHFLLSLFQIGSGQESALKLKLSQIEKKYHSDLEMEYFDFHDTGEEKILLPICWIGNHFDDATK